MSRLLILACLLCWPSATWAQQELDASRIYLGASGATVRLLTGTGTPEGAVEAPVGSAYWRQDCSASDPCLYVKESGTGNTGWDEAGSGGTVTSVALALPASEFDISGSPVTTSGTLTGAWASQDEHQVFSSPDGGGTPTFTDSPTLFSLNVFELYASEIVRENVIATMGGNLLIAPTTILADDLGSGDTTIHVRDNNLSNGDRILLKTAPGGVPQFEVMAVTSGASGSAGDYTYSVTRNLDTSGANAWAEGDAVLNTGTTGDGLLELYSSTGVFGGTGPAMTCQVRTGTAWDDIEERCAVGNLNGHYGYASDEYGFAAGDPSGSRFTIDPTNGVRLISDSNFVTIDEDGIRVLDNNSAAVFASSGYGFNSSESIAGDIYGMYGYSVDAANDERTLWIENLTTANDVTSYVRIQADNSTSTASPAFIDLRSTGSSHPTPNVRTIGLNADLVEFLTTSAQVGGSSTSGVGLSVSNANAAGTGVNAFVELKADSGRTSEGFYSLSSSHPTLPSALQVFASGGGGLVLSASSGTYIPSLATGVGNNPVCYTTSTGQLSHGNGSGCNISARRFKEDIASSPYGLDAILQLEPVQFRYRPETEIDSLGRTHLGFIADDVARVMPEAVTFVDGQPHGLDYQALIHALVRAVQEQHEQIQALERGQ